jgi:hypothetical protein
LRATFRNDYECNISVLGFFAGFGSSDFFLFGNVTMMLMSATFRNDNEPPQRGMAVLNGISREELEAVVRQWLGRLDRCIQRHGGYFVSSSAGALTSLVIAINALSDEDLAHDVAAIQPKTGASYILLRADDVEPCELFVGAHVSNRARR